MEEGSRDRQISTPKCRHVMTHLPAFSPTKLATRNADSTSHPAFASERLPFERPPFTHFDGSPSLNRCNAKLTCTGCRAESTPQNEADQQLIDIRPGTVMTRRPGSTALGMPSPPRCTAMHSPQLKSTGGSSFSPTPRASENAYDIADDAQAHFGHVRRSF